MNNLTLLRLLPSSVLPLLLLLCVCLALSWLADSLSLSLSLALFLSEQRTWTETGYFWGSPEFIL